MEGSMVPVGVNRSSPYGMVSLEVFGHLHFALEDAAPMFEITLGELAKLVNLEYPPPGR